MAQPQPAMGGQSVTLPVNNRVTTKKSKKEKPGKNKALIDHSPTTRSHTISKPTSAEGVSTGTSYQLQLVFQKQAKINKLIESIGVSFGHSKRENLTMIVTEVLKELDFVMNIIQRAKTLEPLRSDIGIKNTFTSLEQSLFANLAELVRWVDTPPKFQTTASDVRFHVSGFEQALEDLVHIMGDAQNQADQMTRDTSPISISTLPAGMMMSSSVPTDSVFLTGRTSASFSDVNITLPQGRKKSVPNARFSEGPLSPPIRSPPSMFNDQSHNVVLCRPHQHGVETEMANSFNNVALSNSHNHTSTHNNEPVPPPKPPRRSSRTGEFSFDVVNGSRSNTTSPELASVEEPPPIPMKKRNKKPLSEFRMSSLNEIAETPIEEPPPVPVKQRRSMSIATASLDRNMRPPTWELSPEPPSPLPENVPVPPDRVTSDPNYRNMVEFNVKGPLPLPKELIEKGGEDVKAIQNYNRQYMENLEEGLPVIPLKKKHINAYQGLFKVDYNFPDELYSHKLILSECPPPIPAKKKRRNTIPKSAVSQRDSVDSPPEDELPPNPNERSSSLAHSSSGYGSNKNSIISGSTESLDDDEENLLEVEDVAAYLRFNKEDDGGYSLRGGPVDALIAYAASPLNIADKHYTEAFLLIYPTFVTHEELINKLVYRLQYFYKENRQTMWTSCTSLLVRVLKNIKMGLSQEIDVKVIGLVYMMLSAKQLKFAQLLRDALITKLKQLIPDHTAMIAALPKMITDGAKKHSLFDFKPEGFAKQMTLLDAGYFYKLDIYEMLCWAAEADEEKSPGLTKFTEHFNNVSQWTKTLILDRSLDKKGRERVMLYFISIMKSLRHINNFNSYLAILSAIESASISRLEWSEKVIKNLEEPRALIDNKGSFKAYRDAFGTATPPCIPYIGLYLQDLTFINMVGDKLEDDKSCINFNKRWKQYNTVDKIRLAQTKQYTIDPDHEILIFFGDFENHLPDSDLYKISLEIKPRGTATVTS